MSGAGNASTRYDSIVGVVEEGWKRNEYDAVEVLKRKKANLENFRQYGSDPFRVAVIHGGPGAAGEVAPVARKLGETRGVLEPIQTARTLDGQVEELRLVLEQNAATPVIFIGHSWGAWLGYIVAAKYPELVRKLILVGSGPFEEKYVKLIAENRLRRLSQEEKEEYLQIVDILNTSETPGSNVLLSRLGELAHKTDAYDPIEIPKDTTSLDLVDNTGEIYQGVWPEAARLRQTGELLRLAVNITCPVVAIHGDCDPHPAQGIQEPLAANVKDFHMIILEKCGHDPWRERHAMDTFYAILERELSTGLP
jgi:pimeloyl-ACP methyl ester carboxylesterase